MKLTEYQNEEALDLLADIIEPATTILSDAEVQRVINSNEPKLKLVTLILRNYKEEVLQIMARLDGTPRSEFKCNPLTLPRQLLEIINDEELMSFFSESASQESIPSGNAMETTEEVEK